jgi:CMP-N,N'-diacetyllegionaminic acid synthase
MARETIPEADTIEAARTASVLAVVPARGGSKRLPGKNIRRLGGLSLLGWTARCARAARLDAVLLTTDDAEIAAEGKRHGLSVPFLRPSELAGDDTPTTPAVLHALDRHCEATGREPALIVLLQVTSPFRAPALVREGIDRLVAAPGADALIAMKRLHVALGHVYREAGGFAEPVAPSATEPAYAPSGALYVIRTSALRREKGFMPPRCLILPHTGLATLDIDTAEDWALAEAAVAAGLARPADTP